MIELKIDNEFRDLLPPLTEEEYKGLEDSLLSEGYDETLPIIVWKGHGIIVDGHNRYGICQKHNIPFVTVEREFNSKGDVTKWMCDIQLSRRSPNKKKRTYIIGRRYLIEKSSVGNPNGFSQISQLPQNGAIGEKGRTSKIIGDQLGIGKNTVERAADFTQAVDTVVRVTGCKVNDLLDDYIKGTMEEINKLAELDEETQKRIIELVPEESATIALALDRVNSERRDRLLREAEERRIAMEEQLKNDREKLAFAEGERLRVEREERLRLENERLAKEHEEQEKQKFAEAEKRRLAAEETARKAAESAKNAEDFERIKRDKEEQERVEKEKLREEIKKLQELRQRKLENMLLEQKRADDAILKKALQEQECKDKEKIAAVKVEIPITPYDPYIKGIKTVMGEITLNACKKKYSLYTVGAQKEYEEDSTLDKTWSGSVWLDTLGLKGDSKSYIEKLTLDYQEGKITEALAVVRNDTGAEWFKHAVNIAKAVVFPLNGELKNHALIYFGNNTETFMSVFEKFGWGTILKN